MNERVIQFRVGVVVVAATIITGLMILILGEGQALIRPHYTVYMVFPEAPGVMVDTPVRKQGILIGRITLVELLDEDGVRLTAKIDAERQLRRSDVCRIKTASLFGDAVVEFEPQAGPSQPITDQAIIADGVVTTNPLEVITGLEQDIQSAIVAIEGAANEVQQLASSVNDTFGGNNDRVRRIMEKSELAIDRFGSAMESMNQLVGDPEINSGLRRSLREFPKLFDEFHETLGVARETMRGIDGISQRAQENLDNLANFTTPLGERGTELTDSIASTLANLNAISEQLVTFSEALNNRGGTLGRLLYDPELYNSFDDTLENLNRMSRRLDPIIDDVRVFTDKISRDPRQLGLKGALDRKPLGLGLN